MIEGRKVFAIVPARGGSTRLVAKNARMLAGRPMVAWTLAAAAGSRLIDHLVVSTDDPVVAAVATEMGWPPPFVRPDRLSGPEASVIDAVEHALVQIGGDWDYVVLLQPTSPLRNADDIDGAIALCDRSGAPSVIAVSPLSKPPGFYGVVEPDGRYVPAERRLGNGLDRTVVINGAVYVGRPEVLLRERTFQSEGALAYPMPFERSWDVDTSADLAICDALLSLQETRGAEDSRGRAADAVV